MEVLSGAFFAGTRLPVNVQPYIYANPIIMGRREKCSKSTPRPGHGERYLARADLIDNAFHR